jgi:hypothetical protein
MRIISSVILLLALSLPGLCQAAFSAVNPKLSVQPQDQQPRKILLMPPQMFVAEMSAGGVIQKQDDWTKQANENLLAAAETHARENGRFETMRMPALSPEEAEIVESHIGLYDRVASAIHAYGQGRDSGWELKKSEWDYTLGDGLAFLREKTGADSALIFVGADIISTGGRKAAFTVGLLIGIAIPLGQSFITVGLADLKTGEIQWLSYDQSMSMDSREAGEVEKLVREFFKTWPHSK